LIDFRKSNEAWATSLVVLTTPNYSNETYFHTASLLKEKMQFDFAEVRKDPNIPL
jgi:hypothetical protein